MRSRGFTIVEILVVIVVISILSSIAVYGFNKYRTQSVDNQSKAMAAVVQSALEKYYSRNNEYPPSVSDLGGTYDGTPPAGLNYGPASSILGVPVSSLNTENIKFVPCGSTLCTPGYAEKRPYVYYFSRPTHGNYNGIGFSFSPPSCTYSIPSASSSGTEFENGRGAPSYILAYWSSEDDRWWAVRSNNGTVTTSDSTNCKFKSL